MCDPPQTLHRGAPSGFAPSVQSDLAPFVLAKRPSCASMLAMAAGNRTTVATLVIRNVESAVHARLKSLAAAHGRSMEEEARIILRERLAVAPDAPASNWVDAIRALFAPFGGLDLPDLPREPPREPPDFSGPEWNPPT